MIAMSETAKLIMSEIDAKVLILMITINTYFKYNFLRTNFCEFF